MTIRQKIVLLIFCGMLVTDAVVVFYIYHDATEEIEELFNAEQAQLARMIDTILERGLLPEEQNSMVVDVPALSDSTHSAVGHHYEEKLAFQVWDSEGNLWMMSRNAPLYPLSAQTPGFSKVNYGGSVWYIFSLYSAKSNSWIYTAQLEEVRSELIDLIVHDQLIPLLVANIVILLIVIFSVQYGMRELEKFSQAVKGRGSHDLSSIDLELPKELEPIKSSVNSLLKQIQVALDKEKSFNADAAHELRTPLAAMRVHTQNLDLMGKLDNEASGSLKKIILSIDKMSHTIEQLLFLNRLVGYKHYVLDEKVDLHRLARVVISELPSDTLSEYDFSVDGVSASIKGNENLMHNLIRNLVENAYKYSPSGSKVIVRTSVVASSAVVEVIDFGPGLNDEQKKRVLERYYRISDNQNYGTGLGFSIVSRIVELHGGVLKLEDNDSGAGLVTRISFDCFQDDF